MHLISIFNREIRVTLRKDRTELLICFFIAAVFWFMVKLSKNYETEVNFQFEYKVPENQAFVDKPPQEVRVTIGGTGWNLMNFSLFHRRQPLVFDLNELPLSVVEGRVVYDRIQAQLAESGLQVKTINLDYLGLKVENRVSKRLPVQLNYQITLEPQFDFTVPVKLTPDSVLVQGPFSLIDSLQSWPTDTGRIGPLKNDWTQVVPLSVSPKSSLELDVREVKLEVRVEPVVERVLFFVPITVVNAPERVRIFPPTVTVYCLVGMSAYSQLDASDFFVQADLKGVTAGSEQKTVPLNLVSHPDFVRNVRISPQSTEFFFGMDKE